MQEQKGLLRKLYDSVGPKMKVDTEKREVRFEEDDGRFFYNLTKLYYGFKGYTLITSEKKE